MSGRDSENINKKNLSLLRDADRQLEIFTRFVETSGQALGLADLEGRIFFVNSALLHELGEQSRQDAYHHYFFDYYTPETAKRMQDEILPCVFQQGHWVGELNLINKHGYATPIIENIFLLMDYTGKPLCFATVITDISERVRMEDELRTYRDHLENLVSQRTADLEKSNTLLQKEIAERKKIEEALKESEARYRQLFENAPAGIYRIDYKTGKFLEINDVMREYLGFCQEELASVNPYDILTEDSKKLFLERMNKIAAGEPVSETVDYKIIDKKGKQRRIQLHTRNIYDADGHVIASDVVAHDITERKRIEQALEENLSLLAEAERMGMIGSWKTDMDMNPVRLSSGLRRIWGFPEDHDVTSDELVSRIHPDDRDQMLRAWRAAIDKRTPFVYEYRIVRPDGTVRHIVANSEIIFDSQGKPVGIHGVLQDVTDRKRLEDEMIKAGKLESIGTLAGGLAHDYNNLLATIMGNIELAKIKMDRTDCAYAPLTKAETAAEIARNLTQQLVTFSKGGHPLYKIIPIQEILRQAVNLSVTGSATKVEWKISADLPEVKIDENQVRQVIHNIVINAREAMPCGGTLFVEADKTTIGPDSAASLVEGLYARLTFRDEGHGIPAENITKVFDPFFTTKDMGATKGTGLGLSICYSILKRHGGNILVEAKESVGTTVTIYIPAAMNSQKVECCRGKARES